MLLSALFAACCLGQVKVEYRPTYEIGEPVIFRVTGAASTASVNWKFRGIRTEKGPTAYEVHAWGVPGKYVGRCTVIDWDKKTFVDEDMEFEIRGVTPPIPPIPPVPPQPDLTGTALEVYKVARAVAKPLDCDRMANNFEAALEEIRQGRIASPDAAQAWITARNQASAFGPPWANFGSWLGGLLNREAQTMDGVKTTFAAIVKGLRKAATE